MDSISSRKFFRLLKNIFYIITRNSCSRQDIYGDLFVFRLFHMSMVVVADPKEIQVRSNFSTPSKYYLLQCQAEF